MKPESVEQTYRGPWAPVQESDAESDNQVAENSPQPKVRCIDQSETSVNDGIGIKLAALRRASEATQKAEFVDADQHAVQVRLEMLEAC